TWSPLGPGLRAEQALRVYAPPDDAWGASLARGGLMRYDTGKKAWKQAGTVVGEAADAKGPASRFGDVAVVGASAVADRALRPAQGVLRPTGKKMSGPRPLQVV